MKFIDLVKFSWSSLLKRKFRTILTVLGVVIGCISIVVMLSLGIGMKQMIFSSMDENNSAKMIRVEKRFDAQDGDPSQYLSDELVRSLENYEHVESVIPVLNVSGLLKTGRYLGFADIYGMPQDGLRYQKIDFAYGGYPEPGTDISFIYGNTVLASFSNERNSSDSYWNTGVLPDIDLVNDPIQVMLNFSAYYQSKEPHDSDNPPEKFGKYIIKTAGVMAGGMEDTNSNSWKVLCDIDALKVLLKKEYKGKNIPGQPLKKSGKPYKEIFYSEIDVYCDDMKNVVDVQQQINDLGFQTNSSMEWIEQEMSTLNIIQLALGGIGGVALLVAAIGITNTMSMSIYERTKEIGIMKVIGCRINDIQAMFLMEAAYIGLIGGVIGLVISYAASYVINKFAQGFSQEMMGVSGQLSQIPLWLALVSVAFSILISMLAGYFPSVRAMKLSPLNAIKNE